MQKALKYAAFILLEFENKKKQKTKVRYLFSGLPLFAHKNLLKSRADTSHMSTGKARKRIILLERRLLSMLKKMGDIIIKKNVKFFQ